MLTLWPFLVSGLCGALLAALVIALIMNSEFRRDLVAGQGKASLFGVVSVEGVIIVILAGMFLAGLLYPVWRFDPAIAAGNGDAERFRQIIAEKDKKIDELANGKGIDLASLPKLLESLQPETDISKEIRALADENRGPWSPYSKSRDLLVSVPGRLAAGIVRGCPELHGRTLEMLSTYRPGGTVLRGEPTVRVKVTGLIFSASDCREKLGYDLQMNCSDAVRLFSEAVLTCDRDQQPLWPDSDKKLPVSAAVVSEGG